ncbi:MAG: GNAT family N-acetyltransferase [Tetrasphaera sp.]
MARSVVAVGRVVPEDVGALTQLWMHAALAGGVSEEIAARAAAGGRVAEALRRTGCAAFVATYESVPAGFAVVNARHQGLLDASNLVIDELYVLPDLRQHGIGRHLLSAVATFAETEAHDRVFSNVPAGDRPTNRFFARLGFTSTVTRRVVPTAMLRRKLGEDKDATVEVLVGRRRLLKARAGRSADPAPSIVRAPRQGLGRRPATG